MADFVTNSFFLSLFHGGFCDEFLFFFSCRLEAVEMRDGGTSNSELMDKFCRDRPNPQQTWGNALYLRYYSNQQSPNIGFKASVKIGNNDPTDR